MWYILCQLKGTMSTKDQGILDNTGGYAQETFLCLWSIHDYKRVQ